jgi:large subunit ribosomal protein L24e
MKCSFCGKIIKSGAGKMFVENDGTVHYWCSKKCKKNFLMGRDPRKLKWVRAKKQQK